MAQPWTADVDITLTFARDLLLAQFPQFADATFEPFGEGWDNAAFLVGDEYVFRFPRRAFAAPLIEREIKLLAHIANALPVAISVPLYAGKPTDDFPWHFAGYRRLPGHTAYRVPLNDDRRRALAVPLANFLRALHAIDPEPLRDIGLPLDEIGRLNHGRRVSQVRSRSQTLSPAEPVISCIWRNFCATHQHPPRPVPAYFILETTIRFGRVRICEILAFPCVY